MMTYTLAPICSAVSLRRFMVLAPSHDRVQVNTHFIIITNSYSDTNGLIQSTTYYYKVSAVDISGNIGDVSDEKELHCTGCHISNQK